MTPEQQKQMNMAAKLVVIVFLLALCLTIPFSCKHENPYQKQIDQTNSLIKRQKAIESQMTDGTWGSMAGLSGAFFVDMRPAYVTQEVHDTIEIIPNTKLMYVRLAGRLFKVERGGKYCKEVIKTKKKNIRKDTESDLVCKGYVGLTIPPTLVGEHKPNCWHKRYCKREAAVWKLRFEFVMEYGPSFLFSDTLSLDSLSH